MKKHHLPELPKKAEKSLEDELAEKKEEAPEDKEAVEKPAEKPAKETQEQEPSEEKSKADEEPKEAAAENKAEKSAEEVAAEQPEERSAEEKDQSKGNVQEAKPAAQKPPLKERVRAWFFKPEKKKTREGRADEIVQQMKAGQKPKKRRLQRKSLQEYINKAGYSADAAILKKRIFQVVIAIFFISSVYGLIRLGCWSPGNVCIGLSAMKTLAFFAAVWTVIFVGVLLVIMGTIYFFLDYRIYQRTRQVEEVLPDFLQLASANIAAGMPIDRALWYSIRPSFGVLAKEMEEVAKATMSGESLEKSLTTFADKYDSKLLQRSVSILIEGLNSGGELADLLNKIALNIDEIKIMKKEMAANVTTYAIFIIIAAVAIAPVLFALATQLLMIIVSITGSLDLESTSSLFTIGAVSADMVDNFMLFSYGMLIVSSVFGSSIVSVIRRGNVLEGIKGIPVYAILAVLIYKFSLGMFGGVFGSLI